MKASGLAISVNPDVVVGSTQVTRARLLGALARQALVAEAELTPKPGLVDRRGSGSHTDLSLDMMRRSALAIEPFITRMASQSANERPSARLRATLAATGRAAEGAMLRVTKGSNTHKGAIWTLGLLAAAAAALLQGMTAHYLSHSAYSIQPGDEVLIHAGAGGTGLLLTQFAKSRGARVLTTVSNEEKAELSYQPGADDVILYTKSDFADEVRRLTQRRGLGAMYDSIGNSTFEQSLTCLKARGTLVL